MLRTECQYLLKIHIDEDLSSAVVMFPGGARKWVVISQDEGMRESSPMM